MKNDSEESIWNDQVRTVIESSLDAVITIDSCGVVVDWNRTAAMTFGWTRAEAIGKELSELIIPSSYQEQHRQGLEHFRETGEAPVVGQRLELVATRRDGKLAPIELSVAAVEAEGDTYFLAYVRDITEQRQRQESQNKQVLEARLFGESVAEVARAESEEESLQRILSTLCEQIDWPLGLVWIPNESGESLVTSGIWHLRAGESADRLVAAATQRTFHRGDSLPGAIWDTKEPHWLEDLATTPHFVRRSAALADRYHCAFGFPVINRDRVEAVLEFFHHQSQPPDGELLEIVGRIGKQIGEILQMRRLEHQQARLAAIVDSSYDAIIGKDLQGRIVSWNEGACSVYGYTDREAIGQSILMLLPKGCEAEEPEIQNAIQTGERLEQFQTTRRRKDGTLIPISLTVSPIVDGRGRVVGASTIERDISTRMHREQQLRDAQQAAVEANRARGDFLANVSHELRTPMNAILGMTEIALGEPLPDEVHRYITTAHEAAHSLRALLNDILDFSKLESGNFVIHSEPFSLVNIVQETIKTMSTPAFSKGLELVCDMPPSLPTKVIGDPVRLRQLLTNLLGNAIKFTEHGEVILRVETVRLWPGEIRLRFAVSDTGIGVAAEEQRRILEPFAQIDSSTRKPEGTGLGLAICSELLRLMGGKLSLKSSLGVGSTFSFRLSFELAEPSHRKRSERGAPRAIHGQRVLVVDDNRVSRQVVAEMLESFGMRSDVAEDAGAATDLVDQAGANEAYDLLIVDASMPGVAGYELAKRWQTGGAAPIIMMVSAVDRRDMRQRSDESTVAALLEKPVTHSDLLDAVLRALQVEASDSLEQDSLDEEPSPVLPLEVLLAEDVPANQQVVKTVLEKRGHMVTIADNGREAVELSRQNDFDVILMDVQMPVMDGLQATAAIREDERRKGKTTPIIAMTAQAMRGDREKCLEAGMDADLAKPLHIEQMLGLVESTHTTANNANPSVTRATDKAAESADTPVIDFEGVMRRLGNDVELFRELVGFYDEDAPPLMAEIVRAVESSDAAALNRAAHSLKGLAANVGATGVVDTAQQLEQAGKAETLDAAAALCATLQKRVSDLDRELNSHRSS